MNQHDRDNLTFLLTASSETLKAWYDLCSNDDRMYASQLLDRYQTQLEDAIVADQIEQQIAAMPVLTAAQAVIAAVRG
jgi:hypothetical protein